MLPACVEMYINEQLSSENMKLTFKILDNLNTKTVVLTWRPNSDTSCSTDQKHGVQHRRYKPHSVLMRDAKRKAEFQRRQQTALDSNLEISGAHEPEGSSPAIPATPIIQNTTVTEVPVTNSMNKREDPPVKSPPRSKPKTVYHL